MVSTLDYFHSGKSEQVRFYRMPKVLFTDASYRTVPVEAKILYAMLLDRLALSARNGWSDSAGCVFIYFTLEETRELMGCSHSKAVRLFAVLEKIGLIARKKQGQGRPARIYVKNFILPRASDESPVETGIHQLPAAGQTSGMGKSREPPEVCTS